MQNPTGSGVSALSAPSEKSEAFREWYNFEYSEIVAATRNFSQENVLGKGGCSTVYKGTLTNGTVVAVKLISGSFGGSVSNGSVMRPTLLPVWMEPVESL
jgi:hypothetical protein